MMQKEGAGVVKAQLLLTDSTASDLKIRIAARMIDRNGIGFAKLLK